MYANCDLTKVYSWFGFVLQAILPFIMLIYVNYTIIKSSQSVNNFEFCDLLKIHGFSRLYAGWACSLPIFKHSVENNLKTSILG